MRDYTYLGTIITNEKELRPEIEKKVLQTRRAYCAFLLY